MPRVSVVVPTLRGGRFLREAVASVGAQTLGDWELIVVSDGCPDDLDDLEEDPRVRVVRQANRGEGVARNVGVRHATSDLIAFLDDDDRMLPGRLASQWEAMADDSVGLCHTQFRVIDGDGRPVHEGGSTAAQYRDFLRGDGAILLSSTMVRRSVVQEVGGFDSTLKIGDLDFLYRVARETTLHFAPEVLTEYRRHGDNTWGNAPTFYGEPSVLLTKHLWWAQASGNSDDADAARVGLAKARVTESATAMLRARRARAHRDYPAAVKALGQSIRLSPKVVLEDVIGNRTIVTGGISRVREVTDRLAGRRPARD
jgi:glycosyltransferase involved in cell wall biosynthesis